MGVFEHQPLDEQPPQPPQLAPSPAEPPSQLQPPSEHAHEHDGASACAMKPSDSFPVVVIIGADEKKSETKPRAKKPVLTIPLNVAREKSANFAKVRMHALSDENGACAIN